MVRFDPSFVWCPDKTHLDRRSLIRICRDCNAPGGAATRLVTFATTLVGHWPGGLGIAMVLSMGFFAAFCGSILAAITAVGTIMMPKMIEQGYPKPFVVVLAASAALLEALIPPSNAAILYSALTNVPVSQTFAAGVIPGLILLGFMVAIVLIKCRRIKGSKRATGIEKIHRGEKCASCADNTAHNSWRYLCRLANPFRVCGHRWTLGGNYGLYNIP